MKTFLKCVYAGLLLFCIAEGAVAQQTTTLQEQPKNSFWEIGIGAGMDFILFPHYNLHVNAYVLNTRNLRVSVKNQVAIHMPILIFMQTYYPSVQVQNKYRGLWYTVAAGREFIRISSFEGNKPAYHRVDRRFDIGVRWEESSSYYYGFSIPIRLDHDVPWFFTGYNFTAGYRF